MVEWIFKRWPYITIQQACYEDSNHSAQLKTYFKITHNKSTDILEVVAKQISLIGIKRKHEDINGNLQKIRMLPLLGKYPIIFPLLIQKKIIFLYGGI